MLCSENLWKTIIKLHNSEKAFALLSRKLKNYAAKPAYRAAFSEFLSLDNSINATGSDEFVMHNKGARQ